MFDTEIVNDEQKMSVRFYLEKIHNKKNIPILKTGRRVGATGYIDYINKKEITDPVMKGIDYYGRKFIVIKAIVDKKVCIQTFFQRYDDCVELWMGAHVGGDCYNLLETVGGMKPSQAEFLYDLVEGKIVKFNKTHRPCYYFDEKIYNKQVNLYDEKKWNAALTIQNYWDYYRYHPEYKLCQKLFEDEFKQIKIPNQNFKLIIN